MKRKDRNREKEAIIYCIILAVVLTVLLMANIAMAEEQTVETAKVVLRQKADEFPGKKVALAKKEYAGTFDDILAQRFADVNDVAAEARLIVDVAAEICRIEQVEVDRSAALSRVLGDKTEKTKLGTQSVILDISRHVNDEINAIDPNEPDAIEQTANLSELLIMLLEMEQDL